tara:strand:- start:301 stop:543 length:243 start_codon:yes stop_codon:yes gene_type:complete
MEPNMFQGEEALIGKYVVLLVEENQEAYVHYMTPDNRAYEFTVATDQGAGAVSGVLRQCGFTIDGFKTATILPFKRPEVK